MAGPAHVRRSVAYFTVVSINAPPAGVQNSTHTHTVFSRNTACTRNLNANVLQSALQSWRCGYRKRFVDVLVVCGTFGFFNQLQMGSVQFTCPRRRRRRDFMTFKCCRLMSAHRQKRRRDHGGTARGRDTGRDMRIRSPFIPHWLRRAPFGAGELNT